MTEHEVSVHQPSTGMMAMRTLIDSVRARHAQRIWPEISNPTAAQSAAMPHMVECFDLTVHDLGDTFADEFRGRRLWCRQHCEHEFTVQPV